jgi:hypothetical protein
VFAHDLFAVPGHRHILTGPAEGSFPLTQTLHLVPLAREQKKGRAPRPEPGPILARPRRYFFLKVKMLIPMRMPLLS